MPPHHLPPPPPPPPPAPSPPLESATPLLPQPSRPPPRRPPPSPWTAQRLWSGLSVLSKKSFRTSSFEADDERSSRASCDYIDDSSAMSDTNHGFFPDGSDDDGYGGRDRAVVVGPRYVGQDRRPTSAKELLGWYAYAFAAETYPVCAIGSFIPILLETLARQNGVLSHDRSKPCPSSDVKDEAGGGQCIVTVLGFEVSTASFAMYTFSFSVLVQALLVVSISSAADHGNYRKRLLLTFGWLGGFSVMAYVFIDASKYLLGALLAIVSNTAFGASFVLLNSFLPLLVRHHPDVLESRYAVESLSSSSSPPSPSLPPPQNNYYSDLETPAGESPRPGPGRPFEGYKKTSDELAAVELQLSTQISTKGVGIGYSAALFVQCLAIGVVVMGRSSDMSLRLALLLIGSWWVVFTIPSAVFLRPRPGPPLVADPSGRGAISAWFSYMAQAWISLGRTAKLARRLADITLFLGAWFLLSDAIATTTSTAIMFAKNELHMKPWSLAMINVISTTFGIAGAFGWPAASRLLGLKPHQTMLACIALFEAIPFYGLLGYLPIVQQWGVFGLQQPWEMYPLAALFGFVLGGLSGYSRSLFGELIPPGSEAAFYALYAITDKGSSVFGPSIVGLIIDSFGGIRPAFWFLLLVVGLPAPLLYCVDMERGKREGERVAQLKDGLGGRIAGQERIGGGPERGGQEDAERDERSPLLG